MGEAYPKQVDIKQDNIDDVIKLFKNAYDDISKEIVGATDFGVANRKAILAQVERILKELQQQSDEFLQEAIPGYYEAGADQAVKQLKNVGADVSVQKGFNNVHKEAIASLVDGSSKAIAESVRGVYRSTQLLLGKAVRDALTQKLATGMISGEALNKVRQQIKGALLEQGLAAVVDRSGKKWRLETYAEMVFRTKAVESHNRGLVNRMVENDYDLVQVSSHPDSCPICSRWQGEILSITGNTPGYKTVSQAEEDGLFHPNCRHALNGLIPSLAKKTKAYNTDSGKYE